MIPVANESPSPETATRGLYEVLVSQDEELALWPADREIPYSPSGWLATGKRGTERDCLQFIDEHSRRLGG
jgi:uncharacterized protein YbdZ (MbtH family)